MPDLRDQDGLGRGQVSTRRGDEGVRGREVVAWPVRITVWEPAPRGATVPEHPGRWAFTAIASDSPFAITLSSQGLAPDDYEPSFGPRPTGGSRCDVFTKNGCARFDGRGGRHRICARGENFSAGRCLIRGPPFVEGWRRTPGPRLTRGAAMTEYLIYFNQQWVGDHTEEWFRWRGPLAKAVVKRSRRRGSTCSRADWWRRSRRPSAPTRPAAH